MDLSPLKRPPYKNLLAGQAISQLGDYLYFLIFLYMVKAITKSDSMVGAVAAVQAIPVLLLSPYAGALAHRYDRRKIMLFSDLASAGIMFLFAAHLLAASAPSLAVIFASAIGLATVNTFFLPAKSASIPRLVGESELVAANSLSSSVQHLMPTLGLVLSAIALGRLEATVPQYMFPVAAGLNGLTFLGSALFLRRLPAIQPLESASRGSAWQDSLEGVRWTLKHPTLRVILIQALLTQLFIAPFMVAHIHVNAAWFKGNYQTIASFEVAFLGSAMLTSLFLSRFTIRRAGIWFMVSCSLVSIFVAAMSYATTYWPYLALNVACGLAFPFMIVPIQTYVQSVVHDSMLGRVNSAIGMMGMAAIPLSNAMAGSFLTSFGPHVLFLTMGLGMLSATLLGLFSKPYVKAEIPGQTSPTSERP